MEEAFKVKLLNHRMSINVNSVFFSKRKYGETIEKLRLAKSKQSHKQPIDYRLLQKYDIFKDGAVERLVVPSEDDTNYKFYVHDEELFQILMNTHMSLGHAGRDRMMNELRKDYKNITYKDIMIFLSVCKICNQKHKRETTGKVPTQELNTLCQVDLIDFHSYPDGDFKLIMVYQEMFTKFCILKPLKSDDAKEVADNLLDIFTIIGPPAALQSEKGSDFLDPIIDVAKDIWCELQVTCLKSEQGQSIKSEIENLVTNWMRNNKTSKWGEGLQFVQLTKNTTFHPAINRTPYEALFSKPLETAVNDTRSEEEEEEEEEEQENVIDSIKTEKIKEEIETSVKEEQDENVELFKEEMLSTDEEDPAEEERISCQQCGLMDTTESKIICEHREENNVNASQPNQNGETFS